MFGFRKKEKSREEPVEVKGGESVAVTYTLP